MPFVYLQNSPSFAIMLRHHHALCSRVANQGNRYRTMMFAWKMLQRGQKLLDRMSRWEEVDMQGWQRDIPDDASLETPLREEQNRQHVTQLMRELIEQAAPFSTSETLSDSTAV